MTGFLGIDLCGPMTRLVAADSTPGAAGGPLRVDRTWWPDAPGGPDTPLWDLLGRRLRLGPGQSPFTIQGQLAADLQEARPRILEALGPNPDAGPVVAVVYPHRTPPVLRRHLPVLLGEPVIPPGGGRTRRFLAGLEAPAALAIEAVARGLCAPPADLLVVTGAGPARELSAVSLAVAEGTGGSLRLRLRVRASVPLPGDADVADAPAALAARGLTSTPWDRWVFLAADPADDVADALGVPPAARPDLAAHGLDDPALAPALGAIRFAGLDSSVDRPMLGHFTEPVEVRGSCAAAVGVVGSVQTGDGNRRCWHRLFPAGTAQRTDRVLVQSDKKGPSHRDPILLAEALAPDLPLRWLAEDEWDAAGLSLHEVLHASPTQAMNPEPEPGLHAWSFLLDQRDPRDPWGLLPWTIQYRRGSN